MAAFLPAGSENNADAVVAFLASLQKLTAAAIAVLILHHPRKKSTAEGRAARGSGALAGAVDVLIEMTWVARPSAGDNRRRLKAWSRHRETPPRLIIEMNDTGTNYTVAPAGKKAPADDDLRPALRSVLADAPYKLTRQEILERWPAHASCPSPNLLWRWLDRAVRAKLVMRDGAGGHKDPYRFWLPYREQDWNANPLLRLPIQNFESRQGAHNQNE